jgi:phosphatidylserine/phosphatidylglycerophosphate/cardiolipin synthase-like enzyme
LLIRTNNHVLLLLQEMTREASDSVTALLTQPGFCKGDLWDRNYERDLLPTPAEMQNWYTSSSPVRFLQDRDDYIATFAKLAMGSKSSIKVCTCYLFTFDPAHRYILLDLLPCLAQRGISVQIMFDLLTIESSVVRDAFYAEPLPQDEQQVKTGTKQASPALGRAITNMSFLEHLSSDCPAFEMAKQKPASALEFLNQLMEVSSSFPAYQIKFWCARDATCHYRIKNHAKCILFDCNTAFIGGSNITPTVRSASSDCDLIVAGEVARQVNDTFTFLWDGMSTGQDEHMAQFSLNNSVALEEEKKQDVGPNLEEEPFRLIQDWDDVNCRIALVRSEPNSSGEDAILRAVLGAIHAAETSIIISMGHSNVPKAVALALHDACKRGVQVQMLHNSLYSNDLRGGQRDLFLSLRDLLQVAPDVQVWTTAMTTKEQPPFLHSKYVVIDGNWSCVGSWNLWTRSAFYEIEHELLIYSEQVASFLEAKFERERAATSVRLDCFDCLPGNGFCPTGCELCRPFGPFFA